MRHASTMADIHLTPQTSRSSSNSTTSPPPVSPSPRSQSFRIKNNKVEHWLKNDNENETKIWRYNHFHSHGTFIQKRAILTACLRKVQKMASTRELLIHSGTSKIREFQKLAYPNSILKGVCTFLAATTGNDAWIAVRSTIR